jgi:deoxyuridine 5'-triphosphate nucleotidohydrolase
LEQYITFTIINIMTTQKDLVTLKESIDLLKKDVERVNEQLQNMNDDHQSIIDSQYSVSEETAKFQHILGEHQVLIHDHGKLVKRVVELAEVINTPVVIQLLTLQAKKPEKASIGSAGFDLYASESITINNDGKYQAVKTGVAIQIPPTHCGKIASRSGLALKKQIVAFEGTIDSDYRKKIIVLLKNNSDLPYEVKI